MLYYFNAHSPQLLSMFVYVAKSPSVNITISKSPMCQEHKGPPLKIYLWDETRGQFPDVWVAGVRIFQGF